MHLGAVVRFDKCRIVLAGCDVDIVPVVNQIRIYWWCTAANRALLGHARLPDIDAELEKLAVDTRRAPEWIGDAYLADELSYFERHRWSTATRSRLPAPVRSESRAMPTNNGVRLHDRQRIANVWKQPIENNEYQAVEDAERNSLRSSPPQNVYLLSQRPNLCLERCP